MVACLEGWLSPKASADKPLAVDAVSVNNEEDLLPPLYSIFLVFCTVAVQGPHSQHCRTAGLDCVDIIIIIIIVIIIIWCRKLESTTRP